MPDMYYDVDTAVIVPMNIFPITDDTDFKSIEPGLAYNTGGLVLYWHFCTTAGVMTSVQIHPTTGGVHDISEPIADVGMYGLEIPASGGDHASNDTEGFGWVTGFATGMLPWRGPVIGFRAAAINNSLIDGATVDVNATKIGGTTQTGRDIGASVLLSSGTGTGQLDFTSGVVKANLVQYLATAFSGTAAQIVAAFVKFFDKASPTGTVNSLPDAVAGANGGLPTTNGTKMSQTVDLTAGQTISITRPTGTIVDDAGNSTTVFKTNLTSSEDDYIKDAYVKFTSGADINQVKKISAYNGTSKVITTAAFTDEPAENDTFVIINE